MAWDKLAFFLLTFKSKLKFEEDPGKPQCAILSARFGFVELRKGGR
jgi:hypothetical protein